MSEHTAETQLLDGAMDSMLKARQAINAVGICNRCLSVAETWYRNLPRANTRRWPGASPSPFVEMGRPQDPRILAIEWDTLNYQQIKFVFDVCRKHRHRAKQFES